jgi:hypothetical protein
MGIEGLLDHSVRRRMLITYAVVSRELDRNQDILFGLLPFFEPILLQHNGEVFDKEAFVAEVSTSLHWSITSDLADQIKHCFVKKSWLRRVIPENSDVYRICLDATSFTVDDNTLSRMDEISEALDCFLDTLPTRPDNLHTSETRKEIILEWLVESFSQMHISDMPARSADTDNIGRTTTVLNKRDWHICARFALWLSKFNPTLAQFLTEIGGAVILTEVLLHFRAPPTRPKKLDIVVFVDAPLLMDYLGTSGQVLQSSAANIIDKLRSMGASIACFGHSRDEIRSNLRGYLDEDEARRFGPTADAARRREVDDTKIRGFLVSLDRRIKQAGVEVLTITPGQLRYASEFFPDALIEELSKGLGQYNYYARERDAKSVAVVMRKRRAFRTGNLLEAKAVLLSQSRELIAIANSICIANDLLGQYDVGPVIHRSRAAGALFVIVGSDERGKIARHELLGTCMNVVRLRPQIVADLKAQLNKATSALSEQELDSLLTDPRCATALMDSTVGSGRTIDRHNVEEIIENIRKSILDTETQKHAREIHDLKLDARSAAKELADAFESRISDLERKSRNIVDYAESLQIQLQSAELSRKKVLTDLVEQLSRQFKLAKLSLRIFCVILTTALLLACLVVGAHRFELLFRLALGAVMLGIEALAIFGFNVLERSEAKGRARLISVFEQRVVELGLEDVRKYYTIDLDKGNCIHVDTASV